MSSNGASKPICRGCANQIDQGSIVQFGNGMWHLSCFNCVKCHSNIEPDSNLLLLSDGSPLCSDCSQHCSVCSLPISDEAVMTADQCYHASCFKCTKCNNKIEGSLFARTSSGIYCMSCYAERREAQKKRGHAPHASKAINSSKEKSLPSIPVEALFELKPDDERPSSAGSENKVVKPNSNSSLTSHQHTASNGVFNKSSLPRNLPENSTDVKRMPTLARKTTKESVPTSPSSTSTLSETSYSQIYVDGLRNDIKTLQRQLADSEFGHSKLKLHNDQVTERIKVFQEEFSNEINRRKAAETALQKLESEHQTNSNTINDLFAQIAELNNEKNRLQAEVFELKEQKELLNEEIAAKIEVQKLISEPVATSDFHDSPITAEFPKQVSTPSLLKAEGFPPKEFIRKKKSSSTLDEIIPEGRVISHIHHRYNSGGGLRSSLTSEGSLKARLSTVRRSLDARPSDDGFPSISAGKRTSMDDITVVESSSLPDSVQPSSTPGSPSSQSSNSNSQHMEGSPSDRESKNSSSKRFNWKNAFKIAPRPAQSYSDNSALKAQISSPKGPSSMSEFNKTMISGPLAGTAPIPSPSSELRLSSGIPSLFASLDAPLGDQHILVPHPYLRPVRCDSCKEKMWGLQTKELRCSACGFHCHNKCAPNASYDCPGIGHEYPRIVDNLLGRPLSPGIPSNMSAQSLLDTIDSSSQISLGVDDATTSPNVIFGVELRRQLELEGSGKLVPRIVEQCVQAVETKAMNMEGIYRKSGPQSVMKSLRNQLVASGGGEQIDLIETEEFRDITAVTSVLKQYFRELPIPLFTYEFYEPWIQASVISEETERAAAFARVLRTIPEEYRETLTFFMDHLHRIYQQQKHNLMSSKNIGVVFGPTLMRCQNDQKDFDDMAKKNATVDLLVQSWSSIKEINSPVTDSS